MIEVLVDTRTRQRDYPQYRNVAVDDE